MTIQTAVVTIEDRAADAKGCYAYTLRVTPRRNGPAPFPVYAHTAAQIDGMLNSHRRTWGERLMVIDRRKRFA